jgi:pimeloyl-ACP methyl ester carboxylesterase
VPLYLIHGALGSADQLLPLEHSLAAIGDVRRVELAGHGATPLGNLPFTIETFAAQLLARLDADGVECADIFGYSMGGYVALTLALEHSPRIRRIVTLGTKFEWTSEVAAKEAGRLDAAKMRAKVPRFAEQLERRHAVAGGWEQTLAATASLLTELGDHPRLTAESLARISIPVCIGVGDRDATVSVEESARISRQLGAGSLMVLPNTPHPLEQVDHPLLADLLMRLLSP